MDILIPLAVARTDSWPRNVSRRCDDCKEPVLEYEQFGRIQGRCYCEGCIADAKQISTPRRPVDRCDICRKPIGEDDYYYDFGGLNYCEGCVEDAMEIA